MKRLVIITCIVCFLICLLSCSFISTHRKPESNSVLFIEKIIKPRIKAMNEHHGTDLPIDWIQQVKFEIPKIYPPGLPAIYESKTQAIMFNSYYHQHINSACSIARVDTNSSNHILEELLINLVNHEIGHAIADWISRKAGNGEWPNLDELQHLKLHERLGIKIISEGIADYFAYIEPPPANLYTLEVFPDSLKQLPDLWFLSSSIVNSMAYGGGYWVVSPIISKYGETAVVYLTTHPLKFPDGKIKATVIAYQKQVLEDLASQLSEE